MGKTTAPSPALTALGDVPRPLPLTPREAWKYDTMTREDGCDLVHSLRELRRLVPPDSDLADLQRQAWRAYFTDLPLTYLGAVVLSFCERWLELADADEPARFTVAAIARGLRGLDNPGQPGRQRVHNAAQFVRVSSRRARVLRPRWAPDVVGLTARRERRRESRPRRHRLRNRSGSRGDPPDESDPPDLDALPGTAGPVGLAAPRPEGAA
jgi:hypothetical protein